MACSPREKRIPLGRLGEHLESRPTGRVSAQRVQAPAYITGTCVTIDGGESLRRAHGEFNALESVSSEQWDALQAAMKPKKK